MGILPLFFSGCPTKSIMYLVWMLYALSVGMHQATWQQRSCWKVLGPEHTPAWHHPWLGRTHHHPVLQPLCINKLVSRYTAFNLLGQLHFDMLSQTMSNALVRSTKVMKWLLCCSWQYMAVGEQPTPCRLYCNVHIRYTGSLKGTPNLRGLQKGWRQGGGGVK